MKIDEIQAVCFIGAGSMGCYNAIWAAVSGYDVVLYDINPETLDKAPQRCLDMAGYLAGAGYCNAADIPAARQRISLVADLAQATANADLVSESVFERVDVKREVHAQLDSVCPAHTILTTNSSTLLVSDIEDVVQRSDRFAALHFHMASPLVDIVPGPQASAAVVDILERYVLSLKGSPLVLKKEYPGYVLNAVLGPVLTTAQALVVEGVASPEDVDRAWMSSRTALIGPFGLLDLFGLNLIYDKWQHRDDDGAIPGLRSGALDLLRPYVERGELGMQSGKGFYRYPEPEYQQFGFLASEADLASIAEPLTMALVSSAILVAAAGVAEPEDIDRAWTVGVSLNTGPFEILQQLGATEFLQRFSRHVDSGWFDAGRAEKVAAFVKTL